MFRRHVIDRCTQTLDPNPGLRPQRLFDDNSRSSEQSSFPFALEFLQILSSIVCLPWRFVSCFFKCLHKISFLFAKHIYKLTCRVMLLDTRIMRSSRAVPSTFQMMILLCALTLSALVGFLTIEVFIDRQNDGDSVSDYTQNTVYPPSQNEKFYCVNKTSDEQEIATVEYPNTKQTSEEIMKELMETGVIQNAIQEYTEEIFENHDYSGLQTKLQHKVQEQQQIIMKLYDEISIMKFELNSMRDIRTKKGNSEIKLANLPKPRSITSYLNDLEFLKEQKTFKNWLLSMFVTKNELDARFDLFDADKTGLVDYSMGTFGGEVIEKLCSENYPTTAALKVFGIPLWSLAKSPRIVIMPRILYPGDCWAFQKFPGVLMIRLRQPIHIESVSYEHVSKSLVADGNIRSAPKDIEVHGSKNEEGNPTVLLGVFKYDIDGDRIQFFKTENTDMAFYYVEVVVNSNHGHPRYTCMYRIRVHGKEANCNKC